MRSAGNSRPNAFRPLAGKAAPHDYQRAGGRAVKRAEESVPVILETAPDEDYALIDSGDGRKLERYGARTIIRPEAQAMWRPTLEPARWQQADAEFTGDTEEEGIGRWRLSAKSPAETWPLKWDGIGYLGRYTSFRHVGVFPEQAVHWRFIQERLTASRRHASMLNLFAYTGIASLAAARAGANVTHVDASRKAIGWARENQEHSGLHDLPIRWICDDAVKFCERELRRGKSYDAVVLDPPKYGRGPKGEIWQLFENLPDMLALVRRLLSDKPLFVVLTAYSIRASFFAMHELMRDRFAELGGRIESGELILTSENGGRRLSTSLFSRWYVP